MPNTQPLSDDDALQLTSRVWQASYCAAPHPPAALLPYPQMPDATLSMLLNITQPLMNQTGQLRWAINNVAGGFEPCC